MPTKNKKKIGGHILTGGGCSVRQHVKHMIASPIFPEFNFP